MTQGPIEVYSQARVIQCPESRAGTSIPRVVLVGSEPLPSMMSGGRWGLEGSLGSVCQGPDWGAGSWMQWANNQESQGGARGPSKQPALAELQGSDQAFPLITNRQNMSRTLPGPSTPHPGLHQERIFKG